jgi:integrase
MPIPQTTGLADHLRHLRLRDLAPSHIAARNHAVTRLAAFLDRDAITATVDELLDHLARLPRTTNRSRYAGHSHLACFFAWTTEQGITAADPMRKVPRPKLTRLLPRPMSEEDTHVAIDSAPSRIRVCLVLAGYSGLRACEIAALERSDILDNAQTPALIAHGKGRKDRVVPLGERTLAELRAYGISPRGPLIRRAHGPGGVSAHRISTMCNEYLHGLGITDSLHTLRHRFATQTYAATQDVLVIAALLGHEDPATTAGYAAYSNPRAVAAVRALDGPRVAPV